MTAVSMDFSDAMYKSLPYVFAFVLGLAFILLLVMFRSIVIPVKAILLNLLSVAAAYGVLVMVFQWGWGISLLGSESPGVVAPWLPLILFTILFGLSMDYHMLLLSRIKEAYDQGHGNDASVSEGIRLTAGTDHQRCRHHGGGLWHLRPHARRGGSACSAWAWVWRCSSTPRSSGRCCYRPSMKLLGDRNWYLPKWLDWLPKVTTEAPASATPAMASMVPASAPASAGD